MILEERSRSVWRERVLRLRSAPLRTESFGSQMRGVKCGRGFVTEESCRIESVVDCVFDLAQGG